MTPTSTTRRILIIEDNPNAEESPRMISQLCRQPVEVAHREPDGIEMARTFLPDVVLTSVCRGSAG